MTDDRTNILLKSDFIPICLEYLRKVCIYVTCRARDLLPSKHL